MSDAAGPIAPALMFGGARCGQAEEAVRFYVATFEDSRIVEIERYGPGEHEREGVVKIATFELGGVRFHAMENSHPHPFDFTPSISFMTPCRSEDELDRLFSALAEGGQALMPPGDYGFSRKFAWVQDRFGVSWQLNWD